MQNCKKKQRFGNWSDTRVVVETLFFLFFWFASIESMSEEGASQSARLHRTKQFGCPICDAGSLPSIFT